MERKVGCNGVRPRVFRPRFAADRPGRAHPRLPRRPTRRTLRGVRIGPPHRAEQADVPGHRHLTRRGGLSGARRRRQDLPPRPVADHARAQGAGIAAGQSGGARGTPPPVGAIRRHRGALRRDRRPHHPAGSGGARRRATRRRGGPELPLRAAGRADVRAVGRRGRTQLARQGADDPAAHTFRPAQSRDRQVSRRRLSGRTSDARAADGCTH